MCDKSKPSSSGGEYLDQATWDALKAAGFSEAELYADQPFGPVISRYTRRQAIEDGVLVDLSKDPTTRHMLADGGVKLPTAMTAAAFRAALLAGCTEDSEGYFDFPAGQSMLGRLWDVLMVLRASIRQGGRGSDRVHFTVNVFDGQHTQPVHLWCLCGPGDHAEPVLTIMLEGED